MHRHSTTKDNHYVMQSTKKTFKNDKIKGHEATDQWYSEVRKHHFGGEPSSFATGHFTQVVWKSSKEIGIGKGSSKDGKTIVVASYRPAGNMMGQFAKNVLPTEDGKISIPIHKDNSNAGQFAKRFEDAKTGFGGTGIVKGGKESKTTKTTTRTEGGVTKIIIEETVTKADGSKVTTTKESVQYGDDSGNKSKPAVKHSSGSPFYEEKPVKKPIKLDDFIDEAVKVHNELRAKHGADKLRHAKDLSEYAQQWAEHLAATGTMQHSTCMLNGERLGENVCTKWSSARADYTGREACDQWYSEISRHNFHTEPLSLGSGHFSQMVWKGTKEIGIGKAKSSGGKVFVVASYRPTGNVVGHFVENVAPLIK